MYARTHVHVHTCTTTYPLYPCHGDPVPYLTTVVTNKPQSGKDSLKIFPSGPSSLNTCNTSGWVQDTVPFDLNTLRQFTVNYRYKGRVRTYTVHRYLHVHVHLHCTN